MHPSLVSLPHGASCAPFATRFRPYMSGRGVFFSGPSSTESPFAPSGRYPSGGDVCHLLGPHYQAIVARTDSGAEPRSSLRLPLSAGWRVLAGCCEPLLEKGPSRRSVLRFFPHVLGPLPRLPLWCTYPFLPTEQRPSPRYDRVGGWHLFHAATSAWAKFSRLQSFLYVQARGFACHPGRTHRYIRYESLPTAKWRVAVDLLPEPKPWPPTVLRLGDFRLSHASTDSSLCKMYGSHGVYLRAERGLLPSHASGILAVRIG